MIPMKNKITILFVLLLSTFKILTAQPEYKVSNAQEFIKAIGSDRIIILQTAIYNLSTASNVVNERVNWIKAFDGSYPEITKVRNMSIKAQIDVKLLIDARYAWVLSFNDCKNVSFENFTIGHSAGGTCSGGVMKFKNCENISIFKCILFGCGTEGLNLEDVKGFTFDNAKIHECSSDLMTIFNSKEISFTNSIFSKTGQYELIGISSCENVGFDNCTITKNWNSEIYTMNLINITGKCSNIYLRNSKITDNKVKSFVNDEKKITLKNNIIKKNDFQK